MKCWPATAPAGSYLVISHATFDDLDVPADYAASIGAAFELCEKSGTPAFSRRHDEIASFFGDFEMVEPGVVWLPQWRLDEAPSPVTRNFVAKPSMSTGGAGWAGSGDDRQDLPKPPAVGEECRYEYRFGDAVLWLRGGAVAVSRGAGAAPVPRCAATRASAAGTSAAAASTGGGRVSPPRARSGAEPSSRSGSGRSSPSPFQ